MLQILFDHIFRHLTDCCTKIAPCPKMSTPIPLLYMRKFFKQLARCTTLNSSHDLARSHIRRTTHQNMHMVFAHHPSNNPYLECLTRLPDKLSYPFRQLPRQNLVAILRNPYKVVLYLIDRVAAIPVIHTTLQVLRYSIAAKADRLKPVV